MKNDLLKTVQNKNIRDYSYAILFLLVASFFAFFVIRPVLGIAIGIRRQGEDLKRINAVYEKNISKVLELQSQIEEIRPKRYLLDDALPEQANLGGVISDIQRAGAASGVSIDSVQIDPIAIKKDATKTSNSKIAKSIAKSKKGVKEDTHSAQMIGAKVKVSASYEGVQAFLNALLNQRRIKKINSIAMTIGKGTDANSPGTVNLNIEVLVESYYVTPQKL